MKHFCLAILLLFIFNLSFATEAKQNEWNHKQFLGLITNSQNNIFNEIVDKYDQYLTEHPDDIIVLIEKCKFIEFAQYDDYEEYNPNQELFDIVSQELFDKYPYQPDVLVYKSTLVWGEDMDELFEQTKESIKKELYSWSDENIAFIYFQVAKQYYYDEDYETAYTHATVAVGHNKQYENSIEYAQILFNLDKKEEANKVLSQNIDTSLYTWELNQRAQLLLELENYKLAFEIFNIINAKDSLFNNNYELASIMVNYKRYNEARKYLLKDTSTLWSKEKSLLALFNHDLNYHGADSALKSYNSFRDLGYASDPFSYYRLKLFFNHPLLKWHGRDFVGIIVLLLLIIAFIIFPSVWILPLYFIGHKWKIITQEKIVGTNWGLKSFWFVSAGYFIASLFALYATPEYLHDIFSSEDYIEESIYTASDESFSTLLFVIFFGLTGLFTLYKVNLKILLYKYWSFWKCFSLTAAFFTGYKLVTVIYATVLIGFFKVPATELTSIPSLSLSAVIDVSGLINTYGVAISLLLVSFFVPIYEEIIFRGVILDACKRYINFRWANIIQAFLFASIHGHFYLFPVYFAFGMIGGILKEKSGGLLSGISFHIVNNLIAFIAAYAKM